jgi:UDP-MurNAc hydroxylase
MTVKLQNPTNAFVRLEINDYIILFDLWLTKGIYEGGWSPYPMILPQEVDTYLSGATHLFISHIHEDHFDLVAINHLSREICVIVPDVYPNHVIVNKLKKLGFKNIMAPPPQQSINLGRNVYIEVVDAMNSFAQESNIYKEIHEKPIFSCDTGVIVQNDETCIVLLSDNTPYCPQNAGISLKHMKHADLLAFPYNGAASDYPLCYVDFSEADLINLSNQREAKRERAVISFLREVSPKLIMPYSSDFAVMGPMAKRFLCFENEWWFSKKEAANRYQNALQIPSIAMFPGDSLVMDSEKNKFVNGKREFSTIRDDLRDNYYPIPKVLQMYPSASSATVLQEKAQAAVTNMFYHMDKLGGIYSQWVLAIQFSLAELPFLIVDLDKRIFLEKLPTDRKVLTCILPSNYFEAILDRKSHWNNAQLSFQLLWKRVPNEYNHYLYGALNFFHLPIL